MGVQKNATYKVHNGTDFDEINFKSIASQIKMASGVDLESGFMNVKSGSGYTKLPNGIIIQWGTYYSTTIPTNGVGGGTIAYPIQFPNACLNLVLTPDLHARGANYNLDARLTSDIATSKSNFDFIFVNDSSSAWGGIFYIAIGY